MALVNIGSETEQIEYKKSIGELKEAMFSIAAILNKEIKIQQFGDRETILVRFEGSRCPYLAYNVPRIRVVDEDLVMDQDTYDAMIRKRDNVDYLWEERVSKYTIDDVNEDAFSEYLRKAKEAGRIDFEDTDVRIVLDKLELIEGNYLLNAGAALFFAIVVLSMNCRLRNLHLMSA